MTESTPETVLTIESGEITASVTSQHNNYPSSEGFIVMVELVFGTNMDTNLNKVSVNGWRVRCCNYAGACV